jgi:hypothetical protein
VYSDHVPPFQKHLEASTCHHGPGPSLSKMDCPAGLSGITWLYSLFSSTLQQTGLFQFSLHPRLLLLQDLCTCCSIFKNAPPHLLKMSGLNPTSLPQGAFPISPNEV